jgi:hypothetical protein
VSMLINSRAGYLVCSVVYEGDDPAACFPPFSDYITALRKGREDQQKSFDRLLALENDRYVSSKNMPGVSLLKVQL